MNHNPQLLTKVKQLGGGVRTVLCGLLIFSVVLSAAPLAGFGRANSVPVPAEEHEEQQQNLTFGCETRSALRRTFETPFNVALKSRVDRRGAANAIIGTAFRQGHRLPNGLMAPLRC